ncbi:MAG: helix-turn-helix transcriptional regulator [Phormidesmis sp. RL_2_1]|nr:helix-turn-helix transcriptional regulator [Phormidesmis sp. RL_2_1]
MRTYKIIKRAIALRNRDIQEVAGAIGTSREHLSRYVNGRSPNFSQELLDKLFEELGLKVVFVMADIEALMGEE